MSDIFISYAREDQSTAQQFATALEEHGYSVWWDRIIPAGRIFDEVIEEAIDASSCVIVLWSNHSANSKWVKTEAGEGANRDILIPVQISKVKPPLRFRQYHTADMLEWDGDTTHHLFMKLLQDIQRLVKPSVDAEAEKRKQIELNAKQEHRDKEKRRETSIIAKQQSEREAKLKAEALKRKSEQAISEQKWRKGKRDTEDKQEHFDREPQHRAERKQTATSSLVNKFYERKTIFIIGGAISLFLTFYLTTNNEISSLKPSLTSVETFTEKQGDKEVQTKLVNPKIILKSNKPKVKKTTKSVKQKVTLKKKVSYTSGNTYIDNEIKESLKKQTLSKNDLKEVRELSFYYISHRETSNFNKMLTDKDLNFITSLPNLRALSITNSDITDAGIRFLIKSKSLRRLSLEDVYLTDVGMMYIKQISGLESLYIKNNDGMPYKIRISDDGLSNLRFLESLKDLTLVGVGGTENGLARLHEALPELKIETYFDHKDEAGVY